MMANLRQKEPRDHSDDHRVLAERLPKEPWPEEEGALAWQARAALRRMLEPENAALERMHVSSRTVVAKLTSTLIRLLTGTPVATARRSSVSMCFDV